MQISQTRWTIGSSFDWKTEGSSVATEQGKFVSLQLPIRTATWSWDNFFPWSRLIAGYIAAVPTSTTLSKLSSPSRMPSSFVLAWVILSQLSSSHGLLINSWTFDNEENKILHPSSFIPSFANRDPTEWQEPLFRCVCVWGRDLQWLYVSSFVPRSWAHGGQNERTSLSVQCRDSNCDSKSEN